MDKTSKYESKEIILNVDTIENVEYSDNLDLKTQIEMICANNSKKIIFGLILIIGVGTTVGVLLGKTSQNNQSPCEKYSNDDYASDVSVKCLQKIWENAGCLTKNPELIPDNYSGWWLQSPQGTKLIPCTKYVKGKNCGAGSFANIITYIYLCKLEGLVY